MTERTCDICPRKHKAHGLCNNHYMQALNRNEIDTAYRSYNSKREVKELDLMEFIMKELKNG
jgi:hypothetical protein